MERRDAVVIKLGGSSITDKGGYETLKPAGLYAAVDVIRKAVETGLRVIVVHGAGSFGHPQAKKYKTNGGWSQFGTGSSEFYNARYGFAATRCSVLKLSSLIVEELVRKNLPATPLPPCGQWDTQGGKVNKSNTSLVNELLSLGFIPILHGDVVLDTETGCSILSGDTIIQELARDIPGIKRVVFLTDVNGVYDKNPELEGAQLINKIEVDAEGNIASAVTTDHHGVDDVTGGMKLKLATAIGITVDSEGRIPVFVCNVHSDAATDACITGNVGERATIVQRV